MIKALWFALKLGALIALVVWIAEQPGSVRVVWQDYTINVDMGFFLLMALAAALLTLFIYQAIKTFVDFPKSLRRFNEIKTREKGYKALTLGLTAVAAGDKKAAALHAKKASKFLEGDTGLPLLLEAQAARLDGREEDAQKSFVALLEDKDASFLGVRGLLQSSLDSGDHESALALAEKALALHPKQGWILKITYDLQTRLGQWSAAEKTLARAEKFGAFDAGRARKDCLVLHLMQAEKDWSAGYKVDAVTLIKKAMKLDPGFVPAAMMLADFYIDDGQKRKAQNVILKTWKTLNEDSADGALAVYWMELLDDGKQDDKLAALRWVEKLLKVNACSAAGQLLAGCAAMEAGLWGEAREAFKRAEELEPSVSLYRALAELEEHATQDEEAVRGWLSKAASAPTDKVWVCRETGNIHERWVPVVQPAGGFNTLEWSAAYGRTDAVLVLNEKVSMAEALIEAPDSDAA